MDLKNLSPLALRVLGIQGDYGPQGSEGPQGCPAGTNISMIEDIWNKIPNQSVSYMANTISRD